MTQFHIQYMQPRICCTASLTSCWATTLTHYDASVMRFVYLADDCMLL